MKTNASTSPSDGLGQPSPDLAPIAGAERPPQPDVVRVGRPQASPEVRSADPTLRAGQVWEVDGGLVRTFVVLEGERLLCLEDASVVPAWRHGFVPLNGHMSERMAPLSWRELLCLPLDQIPIWMRRECLYDPHDSEAPRAGGNEP